MTTTWDTARDDLRRWQAIQPQNAFTSDAQLQRTLRSGLPAERYAAHEDHFARFGAVVAGPLDQAAIDNNRPGNEPKLDRYSGIGDRIEAVDHHPAYDACGRHIYEDGEVIAAYAEPVSNLRALALFYLSSHVGEAGHNCPVACTVGVVKALRAAGSDALKERYLPGLLTRRYADRLDGAQFVTELQGGSDVGANAAVAIPDGDAMGTTRWRISGEKWFCSNVDADVILMTARVAGPGTRGLGLFLVPRRLDDGAPNHFTVRRLKDKLGTRSMPSAEMDFDGAVGYAVGDVAAGFKTLMTQVINTSRVYNTVGCAGIARRARLVATAYARTRQAFGGPIDRFPLMQQMIADMRAIGQAVTAGALRLARLMDDDERGELDGTGRAILRVATNLGKMRSCQHSHRVVLTAIETLGGNGAIETFSVLPRMLRDNVVYENWEGTHNTLIAQTQRDFARHGLHEPFVAALRRDVDTGDDAVNEAIGPVARALDDTLQGVRAALDVADPGVSAFALRPHLDRLADASFAVAFAHDVAAEPDPDVRAADIETLAWFVDRWVVSPGRAVTAADAPRVAAIAALEG